MPDLIDRSQTLTVSDLGEHALIERITSRLAMPPWVVVGPGDDAAVLKPERGALSVVTTDAQIEGVHFDVRFVPPGAVGHRALAVNVSDLAAMGAEPRAALLSLALPASFTVAALDQMLDGFLELAAVHRVTLVGGNVTRSPGPLMIDVTAIGAVRPRRVLTRGGARPGDDVYVTGTIGEASVGLRSLQEDVADAAEGPGAEAAARARYLRPQPRVRAGLLLGRNRAASSCIDLSDGLGDGVRQIASASAVGMILDAASLPIGAEVLRWHDRHGSSALDAALAGGDDYELLFTVRQAQRTRLRTVRQQLGELPITRIGVVTKGRALLLREGDRTRDLPAGFEHFRQSVGPS